MHVVQESKSHSIVYVAFQYRTNNRVPFFLLARNANADTNFTYKVSYSHDMFIALLLVHDRVAHQQSATSTEAVVTEVEGETREPSKEINFADDEGRETAEKRLSAPDENGEVGLVEENDQDVPLPMDEANEIEENEAAVDEEKNSISAIGEEEEGGQGEGIDVDIEQVRRFVGHFYSGLGAQVFRHANCDRGVALPWPIETRHLDPGTTQCRWNADNISFEPSNSIHSMPEP